MITRLILRLPWFLSAPVLVAGAVLIAVAVSIVGGPYFERTYRNDADPLAGVMLPAESADVGVPGGVDAAQLPVTPASAAAAPAMAASGFARDVVAAPPAAQPPSGQTPIAASPAVATQAAAVPTTAVPPALAAAPSVPGASAAPKPAVAAPGSPAVLAQGQVVDGDPGHYGSGRVRLIRAGDGSLVLRFEEFSVTNGPDVFVILSTDPGRGRNSAVAADALNLGKLKATNGNVNYAIPAGTDLAPFRSVILYCRAFHVVMAAATLEVMP